MSEYTIEDLQHWEERIREVVVGFGLEPFEQTFELCDHDQMIGYTAYSGMPSRYPHWSFGKQFEKQKTLYDLGVTGLPYEMVINSDPSLAYLMQDNSLLLQILTIAHVYAHNDFFRNNFNFRHTHPGYTLEKFKAHSDRIRHYREDPGIGSKTVEAVLDAAHALSMNCRRFGSIRKLTHEEQSEYHQAEEKPSEEVGEEEKVDSTEEKQKFPLRPEHDLLLFIRDNNSDLKEWEKDLLLIVHEEAQYFIPQIETKIMNEGWASYWHYQILSALDLPQELHMEFMVRHNQVLRPIPRSLNPYFVGFRLFEDIERRWDKPSPQERDEFGRKGGEGRAKLFQVRETDRDESFIRQYLTRDLMRELNLYQHEEKAGDRVVTKVASEEDWRAVRDTIILNVGMNSQPVIAVVDSNYELPRRLLLAHEFDGRSLDDDYTRHTLRHIQRLWGQPVILQTKDPDGKTLHLIVESPKDEIEVKEITDEAKIAVAG